MTSAEIVAICISEKKGTVKKPIEKGVFRHNHGLEGDSHTGSWHRQISLLAIEAVDTLPAHFRDQITSGAFAENILTRGIELHTLPIGTRLRVGTSLMEVTQIGKECHQGCEIRRLTGDCVMPRMGIFCQVLEDGIARPGDSIILENE
ncbi:MAG: MOSC domain-containing protein [Candidatus Wallbacteria bacterium HGW-Wallbacteria-1]|jgi:MOSC domain-containing protein YiiM|uniref:MOSC domain-containing protein n=1 Tax=Candidatus Wallbacteria bacterium HGW-Wallbacteria-1 TaxID=2013854 RepID=A0A2N1PL91_9BACT|nr:MAG: MOSC domain-containing protein [Candidatus Wallbacteria bacterium HGW-Wallbacteria-1]